MADVCAINSEVGLNDELQHRRLDKLLDKSDLQAVLAERLQSEKCELQNISPTLDRVPDETLLEQGTQIHIHQQVELRELYQKRGHLAQSMIELNSKLQQKDREIQTNEAKMVEYHKRIKKLETECRELRNNLQELERANHTLKNEYNTLQITFSTLEESLQKMADENHELITRWITEKAQDTNKLTVEKEKHDRPFILLGRIGTMSSVSMNPKRTDLPLAEKVKVVAALQGHKASYASVAKIFNISKSQVGRISQNRERILEEWRQNANPNRKRKRKGKDIEVEDALLLWFQQAMVEGARISGPMLKMKAKEFAEDLGHDDFEPTDGWLSRWKTRNNIVSKKDCNERHDMDCSATNGRGSEITNVGGMATATEIARNVTLFRAIQMLYKACENMQNNPMNHLNKVELKRETPKTDALQSEGELTSDDIFASLMTKQDRQPDVKQEDFCAVAKRPRLEAAVKESMADAAVTDCISDQSMCTAAAVTNVEALECVSKLENWLQLRGAVGNWEQMREVLREVQTVVNSAR
uniref:ATG16 autophagy related 16-like 1 (S. cerevisiae) n=1 Tax=Callorhinchus milii TaxID=7868 RepID=A0A4W3I794_CALMI